MDTWWIDMPSLLGSRNPTDPDLEQLRQEGFTVLVSLLMEDEQPPRYDVGRAADLGFTWHNIPVKDFHPPSFDQLQQFVGLIETLPSGAKTIVHCKGGTGRTGTFAAAYWVAKGLRVSEAIARVRKTRPRAIETPEQEAVLGEFASRCAFEVVDAAGKRVRYTSDDFDEIFTTTEAPEMRRHVEIGWLLLDEWVVRDPGRSASWIDTGLRRSAGRVLPAQDDPEYVPPSDVTTYVLGYLKVGVTGTPVG